MTNRLTNPDIHTSAGIVLIILLVPLISFLLLAVYVNMAWSALFFITLIVFILGAIFAMRQSDQPQEPEEK